MESLAELGGTVTVAPVRSTENPTRKYWLHKNNSGCGTFIKELNGIPRVTSYPNVEGELLAPLLLRAAGAFALSAHPIFIHDQNRWCVETPLIEPGKEGLPLSMLDSPLKLREIEDDQLAILCVVDLMMGNADRSPANLLLSEQDSKLVLIPIDHNLAFMPPRLAQAEYGGFVAGYDGVVDVCSQSRYRAWYLKRCGTIDHILSSTPVYFRFKPCSRGNLSRRILARAACDVCQKFTDDVIMQALDAIPSQTIREDPAARKKEIFRTLKVRREAMPDLLSQ